MGEMKKRAYFIGVVFIIVLGCGTSTTLVEPIYQNTIIDFTKYANAGFLFDPDSYNGKYLSLGYFYCRMSPGAEWTFVSGSSDKHWKIDKFSIDIILDSVYSNAISLGADAIMKFNITYDSRHFEVYKLNANSWLDLPIYEISGYMIKRLD